MGRLQGEQHCELGAGGKQRHATFRSKSHCFLCSPTSILQVPKGMQASISLQNISPKETSLTKYIFPLSYATFINALTIS